MEPVQVGDIFYILTNPSDRRGLAEPVFGSIRTNRTNSLTSTVAIMYNFKIVSDLERFMHLVALHVGAEIEPYDVDTTTNRWKFRYRVTKVSIEVPSVHDIEDRLTRYAVAHAVSWLLDIPVTDLIGQS